MPNLWVKARAQLAREAAEKEEAEKAAARLKSEEEKSIKRALQQTKTKKNKKVSSEEEEKKKEEKEVTSQKKKYKRPHKRQSRRRYRRRAYSSSSEDDDDDESLETYSTPPRSKTHIKRNSKKKPEDKEHAPGVLDYLQQSKAIKHILEMDEVGRIFPYLQKRHKRGVQNALLQMSEQQGKIYPHLEEEERKILENNAAIVKKAKHKEEELRTVNYFPEKSNLGKTLATIIHECAEVPKET